jgi:hypothetical protein
MLPSAFVAQSSNAVQRIDVPSGVPTRNSINIYAKRLGPPKVSMLAMHAQRCARQISLASCTTTEAIYYRTLPYLSELHGPSSIPSLSSRRYPECSNSVFGDLCYLRTFAFHSLSLAPYTMRTSTLIGLAAAFASGASAACSAALKIDDFSKWSSNTNSLNSWTSGLYHLLLLQEPR